MKNLVPVCIIIALIVSFAACEIDKTDPVQERMEAFISDVNRKDWNSLKSHTHPDADKYNEANSVFWENYFDTATPLENLSVEGTSATFENNAGTILFKAELKEDDTEDYKIFSIDRDEESIFKNIQQ